MGSLPLHAERLFEVAQPIAAAFDVEHVGFVQQPVKDRGGEHFVAGEQFGPVADRLVGRNQDRAAAVAVVTSRKNRLASWRFIGSKPSSSITNSAVESMRRRSCCRRQRASSPQFGEQLVEAEVLRGESLLDGLDAQAHGQMGLLRRRSLNQHRLGAATQAQVASVSMRLRSIAG
jgi:hypothetical protein